MAKLESKLHKIIQELSERYQSQNYSGIEIHLSDLMSVVISAQESNLHYLSVIQSNLGKCIQAVLNVYSKLPHIPHAVSF